MYNDVILNTPTYISMMAIRNIHMLSGW